MKKLIPVLLPSSQGTENAIGQMTLKYDHENLKTVLIMMNERQYNFIKLYDVFNKYEPHDFYFLDPNSCITRDFKWCYNRKRGRIELSEYKVGSCEEPFCYPVVLSTDKNLELPIPVEESILWLCNEYNEWGALPEHVVVDPVNNFVIDETATAVVPSTNSDAMTEMSTVLVDTTIRPPEDLDTWDKIFNFQAKKDGANYSMLKSWLKKHYSPPKFRDHAD